MMGPEQLPIKQRIEEFVKDNDSLGHLVEIGFSRYIRSIEAKNAPLDEEEDYKPSIRESIDRLRRISADFQEGLPGRYIRSLRIQGDTVTIFLPREEDRRKDRPDDLDVSNGREIEVYGVIIRKNDPSGEGFNIDPAQFLARSNFGVEIFTQSVYYDPRERQIMFNRTDGLSIVATRDGGCKAFGRKYIGDFQYISQEPVFNSHDPNLADEIKGSAQQLYKDISGLGII